MVDEIFGLGSCVLQHNRNRQIVRDAFAAFDGDRYEIGACVVMPNHVHAVIRPIDQNYPLDKILHSRKLWTSRKINEALNQKGPLWQEESFDRIIRDPAHLWKTIQYIGNNPKLAGLDSDKSTRWIRPEWQEAGWDFVDE
ncbi:MAG: transposase [Verrucomicrobiales bacterium]|nr:transposase [Verrucomicrobiales bacterium]